VPKGIGKVGSKSPDLSGLFLLPEERGTMPRTPARHCNDYSPGHTPHFIQGLKSVEKEWVKARVEFLGSNIFQLELEDGQILTRFNHEPGRLLEHLDWFGEQSVQFQSDFYLLGLETGTSRVMFSMSKVPLEACHATVAR
jgi:glutamine cyclotransferase